MGEKVRLLVGRLVRPSTSAVGGPRVSLRELEDMGAGREVGEHLLELCAGRAGG